MRDVVKAARAESWGAGLQQIPATVIDVGDLANVPYVSFAGKDIELNVYGDPASPAGDPTPTGSPDAASTRVPVRRSAPEGFEWTPRIYRGEAGSFFGTSVAAGDIDGSGVVDGADLGRLLGAWGN
jgi:hypothetical protein